MLDALKTSCRTCLLSAGGIATLIALVFILFVFFRPQGNYRRTVAATQRPAQSAAPTQPTRPVATAADVQPTDTRRPQATRTSQTPRLTATPEARTFYVASSQSINARDAASTRAPVLAVLLPGQTVAVIGQGTGDSVSGSNVWYIVELPGGPGYVHSSLLSPNKPSVVQPQPTRIPPTGQPQVAPTNTSRPQVAATPAPQGASCPSLSATCGELTCEQAYACLAAGKAGLDRDGDGVPCESICPGG